MDSYNSANKHYSLPVPSRLRDLQLRQNLAPLRNTLSRAMSGSARVVSSGRSRLLRGMDALWHELDNQRAAEQRSTPPRSPTATDSAQRRSISSSDGPISPILESTTQHAGRLFSNVSSFLSRRQREISQAVESSQRHEESAKSSDDDSSSTYIDVAALYPFSNSSTNANSKNEKKDIIDI